MDSYDRAAVVRQQVRQLLEGHQDERVTVETIAKAWQRDAQDVYERAFQEGGENELA